MRGSDLKNRIWIWWCPISRQLYNEKGRYILCHAPLHRPCCMLSACRLQEPSHRFAMLNTWKDMAEPSRRKTSRLKRKIDINQDFYNRGWWRARNPSRWLTCWSVSPCGLSAADCAIASQKARFNFTILTAITIRYHRQSLALSVSSLKMTMENFQGRCSLKPSRDDQPPISITQSAACAA